MKVALYARYSSDNQRDASITDQLRMCRLRAEKEGWTVVEEYTDHAISGSSMILRRRRRNYFLLLGASALLLSFVVAASHAYYHWGAALVVAADAKYLTSLAGTVSAQWGFLYTVILIVTAGATALSLHQTISEVGEKTVENTEKSLDTWLKDNGLAFTPASGLSAFLLTLAPLATTPFLDALKTLFA